MISLLLIKIILFVVLLAAFGFFNGAETAVVSLPPSYLKRYALNNPRSARSVAFWENNTQEVITAMVIGMNLTVVGMGVLASSLASEASEVYNIKSNLLYFEFSIASIILALIFGSIVPKTYARYNAEKFGVAVLPAMVRLSKILSGIIKFLFGISNSVIRILPKRKESRTVKADEIDFLLSNEKTSPLGKDSRKLVSNIMDFSERRVSHVMTPRLEIFAVDIEDKKEDIMEKIFDNKFSRVPVYKGGLNNIIGVIYSKDIAFAWRNSDIIVLEDLIRPALYVPETAKVSSILKEFKTGRHHMAVVVDEFGSTVGVVSLEDLLEEIVGDVLDENDEKEKLAIPYGKDSFLVWAQESITDLNKELNMDIDEDESFSTVNGWILELFGRIPAVQEKINWKNYEIQIQDVDEKKVNRIIIRKR